MSEIFYLALGIFVLVLASILSFIIKVVLDVLKDYFFD